MAETSRSPLWLWLNLCERGLGHCQLALTRQEGGREVTGIIELLQHRGLPKRSKIKIIRHKDKRCGLEALSRRDFESGYQAYQAKPIFNCDYIISCIGCPNYRARFIGVYRVIGQLPAANVPPPPDFPYLDKFFPNGRTEGDAIWYDLTKVDGFEDLEDQIIISWGTGVLAWAQWATLEKDKEIVEMPTSSSSRSPVKLAEEVEPGSVYSEGAVSRILVNRYERDKNARAACINYYGPRCDVCQLLLEDFYGNIARDFIHVHHLQPVSELGSNYQVDPIKDLRPVCPNCHAVLHRRDPPYSLEEMRQSIKDKKAKITGLL